jgi:hypothetical protein
MTHRVAACPLLIVVDKHVVPGEGAHVECVQGAKEPHYGAAGHRQHQHVQSLGTHNRRSSFK